MGGSIKDGLFEQLRPWSAQSGGRFREEKENNRVRLIAELTYHRATIVFFLTLTEQALIGRCNNYELYHSRPFSSREWLLGWMMFTVDHSHGMSVWQGAAMPQSSAILPSTNR